MADENNMPKSPLEYTMLPVGTVVKFGEVGVAVAALEPLINCKALGTIGQTGGFVGCTTLLDKSKQLVLDLSEGPEKSLGFIDDLENEDFTTFLNAAKQRKTVQFYIGLPNKRTASMILALSGWQMNEIAAPANKITRVTVQGKRNNVKWGVTTPAPDAGVQSISRYTPPPDGFFSSERQDTSCLNLASPHQEMHCLKRNLRLLRLKS